MGPSRKRITIRWSLFWAFSFLVLFTAGTILAASLLRTSRLTAALAGPIIDQAKRRTVAELDHLFEPVTRQLGMARWWVRNGHVKRYDNAALKALFLPGMMQLPRCVSMMVSDMTGYEFTIFRNESGGEVPVPGTVDVLWTTRDFRREQWGKLSKWVLWDATGTRPLRRWSKDLGWTREEVLKQRPSGTPGTRVSSISEDDLIYDPRPRIWHAGAREQYRTARSAGTEAPVFWSDVDFFFTSKAPGITGSIAVEEPNGDLVVIGYDVLLRDLSRFTSSLRPTTNGKALIFSGKGEIVGVPADGRLGEGKPLQLAPVAAIEHPEYGALMKHWKGEATSQRPFRFSSAGREWWACFHAYTLSAGRRLWTAILVPESDVLRGARREQAAIVLLAGLAFVVAVGLAWYLARSFSRPLRALMERSRAVAALDLRPSPPVSTRLTEIDRLLGSVEEMKASLKNNIEQINRSERDLEASERKFRYLAQNVPALFGYFDDEGRYQFINKQYREWFGVESAVTGEHPRDVLDGPICAAVGAHAEAARAGEEVHVEIPVPRGGATRWLLASFVPDPGEDGWVQGVYMLATDITEMKKAEEDRRELERQLQQAQRLESLGVLAGGIAHDFNNLLVGIVGNIELLQLGGDPEEQQRCLREMEVAASRAAELASQMLAYSGGGRFVVEPADLNAIIREMTRLLSSSISKKARLDLELAPDLPAVEVDAAQIRQVTMNLIINASEALQDEQGQIRIRTGIEEVDAERLRAASQGQSLAGGSYVFVEVSDTGCGLDDDTRERIFEPFFTTKFTGRGLGLAALQGIVRGHRGAVETESAPGEGSTFRVLLPLADAPAAGCH